MLVYTTTRKKILRLLLIALTLLVGIAIAAAAVLTAVKTAAAERKLPIYCVERGDNKIALTFDCAWGNSNTDELLQILKESDVPATFFVSGEFCDKYPEDVKKIAAAGHEIGNHSDKHPHTEGININDLINDTSECSRKIKMITGKSPSLYRAPYGEYDDNLITTVEGMGMKVIQWSVDSIDWKEPDAETIIERVISGTESGSILLFHNDLENTETALPSILTELKKSGFEFCRVSDMIYHDSYHIDANGKQIYEMQTVASQFITYSNNSIVNNAIETIRRSLSASEIYALAESEKNTVIESASEIITEEQIAAIQSLSQEELDEAMNNLKIAVELYGAGDISEEQLQYPLSAENAQTSVSEISAPSEQPIAAPNIEDTENNAKGG